MAKDYSRVRRGQVFWFDPSVYSDRTEIEVNGKTVETHVQLKTRPVLVVSNNQNNDNAYTCNVVPITSESKPPLPCHVKYIYGGKEQTIEVEQIRTVDISALQAYICTLSDNIMQKVEAAIMAQMDVRASVSYLDITLGNVTNHLQEVVKRILVEQGAIMTDKAQAQQGIPISNIEDCALYLAEAIENLVKKPSAPKPELVDDSAPSTHRAPTPKAKSAPRKPSKRRGGGRSLSNDELQRRTQYVEDCNTLSLEAVAAKYNVPLDKVLNLKYYYQSQIRKHDKTAKD